MASNQIAQLVRKLLVVDRSVPKARLALEAGLSGNALNQVDDETWNPTLRTLNKLEAYLITPMTNSRAKGLRRENEFVAYMKTSAFLPDGSVRCTRKGTI